MNKTKKVQKMCQKMCKKKIIVMFLAIGLFFIGSVWALKWSQYGSELAAGTFNNTLYNSSGEYVYLNWTDSTNTTYATNGTYISTVIDFGTAADFRLLEWEGKAKTCPGNMSYIDKLGGFCIDKYEVSMPNANSTDMGNATEIAARNAPGSMPATSKAGVIPWVRISQTNSRTACTNAGKYLCTSEEWLAAANIKGKVYNLPATITDCNVVSGSPAACTDLSYEDGDACTTGYMSDCISSEGVYDMVGNVWEWTNESVSTICPCGNCASANAYCYPSDSGWQNSGDSKYGNDGVYYLTADSSGRAVRRGGRWDSGADAGVFIVALNYGAPDSDSGIGFRCCSVPS